MNLPENKANLIRFLTDELLRQAEELPEGQEVVVAGGSKMLEIFVSTSAGLLHHLDSTQEEADTRIIVHVLDAQRQNAKRVIVCSRDTDVLVLLVHHMTLDDEVWMSAGIKNKPKYIPIHVIQALQPYVRHNLLSYHALTGCDSTSQFSGHAKKSTWTKYVSEPELLDAFTDDTEFAFDDAERFVIKLYSPGSSLSDINTLRSELFHRITNPEKLPPTKDSLIHHLKRCQHQSMIWNNAHVPKPVVSLHE